MNTAGAACLRFALCKQDVAPMATTPYAPPTVSAISGGRTGVGVGVEFNAPLDTV